MDKNKDDNRDTNQYPGELVLPSLLFLCQVHWPPNAIQQVLYSVSLWEAVWMTLGL